MLFTGLKKTERQIDLPIQWALEGHVNKENGFFELTDTELFFISEKGSLKASSLLTKPNKVLVQALTRKGRLPKTLIDATCGYSCDSLSCLRQGIKVTAFENNPFALIFIAYLMQAYSDDFCLFTLRPQSFSSHDFQQIECLYLDPIFVDKRKRQSRLSLDLLSQFQQHTAQHSLKELSHGIKKIRAGTIVLKTSKRQKPFIKGFVYSKIEFKSIIYWRFYTNYQELSDENFDFTQ